MPNAKLSDILRDLPRLSYDSDAKVYDDVFMVVMQVTAAQAANIQAFWNTTIYKAGANGQPNIPGMPKY